VRVFRVHIIFRAVCNFGSSCWRAAASQQDFPARSFVSSFLFRLLSFSVSFSTRLTCTCSLSVFRGFFLFWGSSVLSSCNLLKGVISLLSVSVLMLFPCIVSLCSISLFSVSLACTGLMPVASITSVHSNNNENVKTIPVWITRVW